jgi:hypothetical protein
MEVLCRIYVAFNDRTIVRDEFGGMWKGATVDYFNSLS